MGTGSLRVEVGERAEVLALAPTPSAVIRLTPVVEAPASAGADLSAR
jgi:hypothetical protein